jgi:hypothetical protein
MEQDGMLVQQSVPHYDRAGHDDRDGDLLLSRFLYCLVELLAPVKDLVVGVVRATDVDRRRVAVRILPEVLESAHHPGQLGVVDHVGLVIIRQEAATLLLCFGRDFLHVIQPHGAARGGGRAEGLQLAHCDQVRLAVFHADPLIDAGDVRNLLYDLRADRTPKGAPMRLL